MDVYGFTWMYIVILTLIEYGIVQQIQFSFKVVLFLSTPGLRDHYIYRAQICCHDWLIGGLEHVFSIYWE